MDTTKWKSVLLPRDVYEEIVVIEPLAVNFVILLNLGSKKIFLAGIKNTLPSKFLSLKKNLAGNL